MEGRRVKRPPSPVRTCAHCGSGVPGLIEWHCAHGDWCGRCFFEHLQPSAKHARMLREERAREERAKDRLEHLQKFATSEGGVSVEVVREVSTGDPVVAVPAGGVLSRAGW